MKIIGLSLCAALAAAAVPSAQTSPATKAPGSSFVTVGCLNRGQQSGSLAATAGAPPATPETAPVLANSSEPTNIFILTGAKPSPSVAKTTEPETKPPTLMTYQLEGDLQTFEQHNGHRVEVTGTLLPTKGPEDPATKSNIARIRVQSVKMIARDCPVEPAPK